MNLRDVFAGKKGVLVNVPGAFTPGCSKVVSTTVRFIRLLWNEHVARCFPTQTHLPGFIASYDKFKEAGAEVIVFTAVNDPFVLTEWGVVNGAIGKVNSL